jgi:hypothetical protein
MVNYRYNVAAVQRLGNPNVRVVTVEHKKHNPQYTVEALETMNAWMGEYYRLIETKQLPTLEDRQAYFAGKPVTRMTMQDHAVYNEIVRFIEAGL